jgi:polysaccharide biosynthesis/export protein
MHLQRVEVFSCSGCLRASSLLVAAIIAAVSIAPAASAQNAAKKPSKTAIVTPTIPPETSLNSTNDRIALLAQSQFPQIGDYILDSGDLLGVEVFDVAELTREVRVNETGFISLPLLPVKVRAAGLTAYQLQDKLAELLQVNGLVSNPHVTVSIKEQHGQPITMMGAVKQPMVIEVVRQMTLLEALSRVGGLAEDAAGHILVTHSPRPQLIALANDTDESLDNTAPSNSAESEKTNVAAGPADAAVATSAKPADATADNDPLTLRISLSDLLESGDPKFNVVLRGGDVVSVPRAGVVYAVGAVQRPGGFVMASDRQQLTVLKVLALSGGLMPTAKKGKAVIIRQSAEPDRQEIPVDLDLILASKADDPLMLQSDILFVPNSGGKQALSRIAQSALGLASGVALVRLGNI